MIKNIILTFKKNPMFNIIFPNSDVRNYRRVLYTGKFYMAGNVEIYFYQNIVLNFIINTFTPINSKRNDFELLF